MAPCMPFCPVGCSTRSSTPNLARRIESSRLALPCRERLSCSGGRGWDSRRRGHSRGGHCARDLIMNIMIRSPGCLAGSGGGRGAAPATAAAAMEGDSLARPGLPRGGTQRMHHHPTATAMGVMVPTPCDLCESPAEGAQHKEVAAQPRFSKFWACRREGAPLSLGDKSCEAGEGGLPH